MTAKLSPEGAFNVRKSLESLPAHLFTPNDSKQMILDTGASVTATGDKSDFFPETLVTYTLSIYFKPALFYFWP